MGQKTSKSSGLGASASPVSDSQSPPSHLLSSSSSSPSPPTNTPAKPLTGPTSTVNFHEKEIAVTSDFGVTPETLEKVLREYKPFQEWLSRLNHGTRFVLRGIHVQTVDMFGPKVGFVKFRLDVVNEQGKFVPGIVFMRGGAVAILVILTCEGKEYTLLTVQPRVPLGDFECVELPAGMLDGSGNFAGVAAKEMKEETGLEMEPEQLIDLTGLAWNNRWPGVLPSPGGCDEFLRLYLYRRTISHEELHAFEGKATGVLEEGETIKLKVLPLEELWHSTADAKALSALYLYEKLKETGHIKE